MKFGLAFANTGPFATPAGARELAAAVESAGIESIWTVEHVIWPKQYDSEYPYSPTGKMPGDSSSPIPDPLVWLTWMAALTTEVKLATGILILPERNPLVLAKETATLAALSDDRLVLGIGVGWLEEEFDALGVPFAKRGARTDDYVDAMRALWAGDDASHDGEFSSFSEVSVNPKPPSGSVPIVVGGHSKAAARRAGRLGDGFFPGVGLGGSADAGANLAELLDIVRQTAADAGRDPEAIEITAPHAGFGGSDPVGAAQELRDLGVDRTTLGAFALWGDTAGKAQEMAEHIIAPCADV